MFSSHELHSIRRHLPAGAPDESMVVLDLRQADGQLNHVFFRRWSREQLVVHRTPFVPETIGDWLPGVAGQRPIVLIAADDGEANLVWVSELARYDWFVRLEWPLPDAVRRPAVLVAPGPFLVSGLDVFEASTESLPVRLSIQLGSNRVRNVVSVGPRSDQFGLPSEQWFHLTTSLGQALDRYDLQVGVEPGHHQDVWKLQSKTLHITEVVGPATSQSDGLDSLSVIFDRTCPDSGMWSAAKELLLPALELESEDDRYRVKIEGDLTEKHSERPQDYNRAIRKGVAAALERIGRDESRSRCKINAIWFADDPHDLSWPSSRLPLPAPVGEWRADIPAEELADHFEQYEYTLGLDIWDAVDTALDDVSRHLVGREHAAGVIIVGNSPPPPPRATRSAYHRLLRADPRLQVNDLNVALPSNTSRRTVRFTDKVQELAGRGVQCVYVFLEHHSAQKADDSVDFAFFRKLQRLVFEALSESLTVIPVAATFTGVQRGVAAAYELLTRGCLSSVRIERETAT